MVRLTGTPSSNGLMDLWAEFRILDMGQRLGRYITHYRNNFFVPDKRNQQMIFSYKPRAGAEDAIYRLISDITISMKSADFLKMPECIINEVPTLCSEMFRIKPYVDKPDQYGVLIHSVGSYERIKKWDGQVLPKDSKKPYNMVLCNTLRIINLYVVASLDCYSELEI